MSGVPSNSDAIASACSMVTCCAPRSRSMRSTSSSARWARRMLVADHAPVLRQVPLALHVEVGE